MALVTVAELSSYMSSSPITEAQRKSAEMILAGVQSELEMHIHRPLEPRLCRELVRTDISGFARLSSAPIQSVTKVSYVNAGNLSSVELVNYAVDELVSVDGVEIYDMVPTNLGSNLITAGGVRLGAPNTVFVVEYTGGGGDHINQYLPIIKLAIMRVASREWEHLHEDTVRINNGDIGDDVDPVQVRSRGWQEEELAKFDRIRRRVIA